MGNCLMPSSRVDSAQSAADPSRGNVKTGLSFPSTRSTSTTPSTLTVPSYSGKSTGECLPTPRTEGEILSSSNLKPFAFNELKSATRNFRPDSLLGEGGFGYVFKGWIDDETLGASKPGCGMVVAVKRLKPEGFQGHKEWLTEVQYLGQLHHPNLVKLYGYCAEGDNRLLVYEFMTKGSLENHLFRRGAQPLSWAIRIKVAVGAARGLSFLHDAENQVIYRDFKASNILLDVNFNAKLSDFGLAKAGPTGDRTHVSTQVVGTHGYAAPEYIATGRLSAKADVYSFGVVLLELLSGRRALDKTKIGVEQSLVDWAVPYLGDKRTLFRIMDTCLLMEANHRPIEDANAHMGEEESQPAPSEEPVSSLIEAPQLTAGKEIVVSGVEQKLEPFLGMEFESDEAAKNFYNEYARRVGFPFRVGRSRRSKGIQEVLIMKRFVCSKEGIYRKKVSGEGVRKRERISMREGCKAFMEVIRDKDRWVVSKLETSHTHVLGTCSRAGYLRARGFIDTSEKATIVASDATTLLRQNAFGEGGDAQGLLDYFKRMQADNPAFFYAIQVDNNSCVTNAFWADAKARMAYNYFGEAVTFDTTYKKNKYMMPFVTFSGVNHHLQPVIFGCALLIDETEFSFVWLFETWLTAMGGRPPVSLTTDQNRAMAAAVSKVFPNTRHRFCKWLILSRTKQKLAHAYATHPTLREELERCVIESETVRSFETTWVSIIDKYDLRKNTWLQALFNIRQKWIPLYLKDTFFAEVSPTQKLETVNDLYKKYFNTKTSLKVFLTQFELAMAARYEKEVQADYETSCCRRILKTASPIEKQAADVYTRTMFEKFQEEFVESLGYNAYKIKDGTISRYSVARDEDSLDNYVVTLNASKGSVSCSCGKFEFAGILCRHVLGVLLMVDLRMLPEEYFLRRWTKNAKGGTFLDDQPVELQSSCQETITSRYSDLCRDAIKLSEKGASSVEIYKIAKDAMQKVFTEVLSAEKHACRGSRDAININEEITIDDTTSEPSLHDPQRKVTNFLGQLLGSTWSPM